MMKEYLLSIIIVTYNAEQNIKKTLDSIIKQKNNWMELIIIDGKSTDSTLDICKEYIDYIDILQSESDRGIYDAMNKGVRLSSGKYVYFIGAGDTLLSDVLVQIKYFLNTETDIVYGRCYFEKEKKIYGESTTLFKLMFKNIPHQGMFIKKEILEKYGGYNLKYAALADWWWNILAFDDINVSKRFIPFVIANYAGGGFSEQFKDIQFRNDKKLFVLEKYGYMTYFLIMIRNAFYKMISV